MRLRGKVSRELLKEMCVYEKPEALVPDTADHGIALNHPEIPESEDCSDAVVPVEPAGAAGKKRVFVSNSYDYST